MYQGKILHHSLRMPIPPERQLFLQSGNVGPGDSGLVLSTDAKPRLKWTQDLQAVLEKAQETLGKQSFGKEGLEAAKVQLSELVSNVSTQCFNSTFSNVKGLQPLHQKESERDHDMSVRPYNLDASFEAKEMPEGLRIQESEDRWHSDLKENIILGNHAETKIYSIGKKYGDLSMNIRVEKEEEKQNSSNIENYRRLPYFEAGLDLNSNEENDSVPTTRKPIDLNGLSWV